jgi:hypothetical protein
VTTRAEGATERSPRDEYERRLEARREVLAGRVRADRWIADARLIVFVSVVVLAVLVFVKGLVGAPWLAPPLVTFAVLVVIHERVRRSSHRASRAVNFYEKGLARVEDRWGGTGVQGDGFRDPDHAYSADLDLFGTGSMFERLCTARTRAGEETLAAWLLHPADIETIRERHAALTELRPRLDFREELELLGSDVRAGLEPDRLAEWGRAPRAFPHHASWISGLAALLGLLALSTLVGWFASAGDRGQYFGMAFLSIVFVEVALSMALARRIHQLVSPLEERAHDLVLLSALLARLERESFRSPMLGRLHAVMTTEGVPASRCLARLGRLLHLLDCRRNQFFLPFAGLVLWTLQLSLAIDAWRAASGPAISRWLAAVGEFEALCSLAAYSWECPSDILPEVVHLERHEALFDAERLGHPLIAGTAVVRNDVSLGADRQVLVISGSNMSGKSTMLRTVGINAVLALAGAPDRANRLRLTPTAIGATLRIQETLQAGRSRFFAEITRVRQLVDLSRGALPLLFLLDEIFHGTNSDDRRVGAEAIVRDLLSRGAIGLITTHDLALTSIVERLGRCAENVHFEDQFRNGTMHFDYTMRPGVVRHSNALALMRAVGLDV